MIAKGFYSTITFVLMAIAGFAGYSYGKTAAIEVPLASSRVSLTAGISIFCTGKMNLGLSQHPFRDAVVAHRDDKPLQRYKLRFSSNGQALYYSSSLDLEMKRDVDDIPLQIVSKGDRFKLAVHFTDTGAELALFDAQEHRALLSSIDALMGTYISGNLDFLDCN